MRARHVESAGAYSRILAGDAEEAGRLLAALSTKVTQFFRNPGLYAYLERRILPEILAAPSPGRVVRIWSAGCATGEEAWSLAALVEMLGPPGDNRHVRIIGTDVDMEAIGFAKRAIYPIESVRGAPVELLRRCFVPRPPGPMCSPSPDVRSRARFRLESLLVPPPAGAFDLILCRNVLIYFAPSVQQRVLGQFATALRPGGYLALGRVERVSGASRTAFEVVHLRERLYRRV